MRVERSIGAAVMALLTIAVLYAATSFAWYEYDSSSGRKTPPGGPQDPDDTRVELEDLTFYWDHYESGQGLEPSDVERAQEVLQWQERAIQVAAIALALVVIGELPFIARIMGRPIGLALCVIALGAVSVAIWSGWFWLPETMTGYGVDEPYSAHLYEPDGYVRSTMSYGWYAMCATVGFVIATALFKFQAGASGIQELERMIAS